MGIKSYSTTPASNTSLFPENMAPSSVNDSARQVQADVRAWYENAQWTDLGDSPSRASASTFKITGDVTTTYEVNRRIKCYDASTLYGTISSSSYSNPDTTIGVTLDSGSLTASLTSVAVSILTPTNQSLPESLSNLGLTGTFSASGSAIFKSAITAESTATISGAAVFKTTATVEGALTASATAVFKSTIIVEGARIDVKGTASSAGLIRQYEATNNGTNYIEHQAPASITSNRAVAWPDRDVDINKGTALEYISTWDIAGTETEVVFTNLSSTYIMYKIIVTELVPGTDNQTLSLRTSTNNGSTYDSGASSYKWARHFATDANTSGATGSNNDTRIQFMDGCGNASAEFVFAEFTLFNPSGSTSTHIKWEASETNQNVLQLVSWRGSGARVSASGGVNAIQFSWTSGVAFAFGKFRLYGIRAS